MSGNTRKLLHLTLNSTSVCIKAHGSLVYCNLIACFYAVDLYRRTVNLTLDIKEHVKVTEKTCPVISRTERNNCNLSILMSVCAVYNLVKSSVTAARIETCRLSVGCSLIYKINCVSRTLCVIDLKVYTLVYAGRLNNLFYKV